MTIEDILTDYFKCKKPFLNEPKRFPEGEVYLSVNGSKAYEKLIALIYSLGDIVDGIDADKVVENLDRMVAEPLY